VLPTCFQLIIIHALPTFAIFAGIKDVLSAPNAHRIPIKGHSFPIIAKVRGTSDRFIPIIEHSFPIIADRRGTNAIRLRPQADPRPTQGHFPSKS
jgi:hypothetical protein